MQTKQHHRLMALLLTVVMTFQFIVATPHVAFAEANTTEVVSASDEQQNNLKTEEAAEDPNEGSGYPQVRAAKGGKTVLAFTSDIHNGTASGGETNVGNNRLSTWLSNVQPKHNNSIEVFGFCGDMAAASSNSSTFWTFTKTVMDNIDAHELTGVYAVGNHEYANGSFGSTNNSPEVQGKYILNAEARAVSGENYVIYCLGTNSSHGSGTNWAYDDSQIDTLTDYLDSVGNDKVIIILTHFPLHNYRSHRTGNTLPVLNALNDAALGADGKYGTSDDKKIVFLWGHNHSEGDTNYDEVWQPEDTINNDNNSTVYFFYAAAGSMADSEYGSSGRIKGKGLVLEIDGDNNNRLSFSYYDANGNNVTEPDSKTITEASHEPVAIEEVSITNSNPTVRVGRTLQLKYSTTPSDATVDSVTWSSSNTSIATVNESGKVTGVAEGSATIALSVSDGLSKATRSTSVVVNVTEGGSEEYTVNVTPTTNNPEQSIQIEVGDTLVINTTNGSSNSGYDFTATLSNSVVAEFQGNSTANIAAGSSAAFTVEGVAEGTVDIVIQNSNEYGSQYTRKATIHLTVGSGSSFEDPLTGATVNITPTTDNPEQSATIKVGEALVINVTNGSSNSAYNYTATLSGSGIAEIYGNNPVYISQGGIGQFTVVGLTEGTVDINIQNDQSTSSYARKGVVHLTVGEGYVPPTGDETVEITPTTDNPEATVNIKVDETLVIKVKNGSENNGYNYTATLSNSGIAEIQGNARINIAKGDTGYFTVKGLVAGTVDIAIQNDQTDSQYVRKGVVHLTVGDGSTPVDPPVVEKVKYQLVTDFEDGKEYIIASGNSGSVYVISDTSTGSGNNTGLVGISATAENDFITLTAADAAKAAFTAEIKTSSQSDTVSVWLKHDGKYLYTASSGGLRISSDQTTNSGGTDNTGKYWHYKADGKDLLWYFKDTSISDGYTNTGSTYRYYINCSNTGTFTSGHVEQNQSLSDTNTPKIYIFEKSDQQSLTGNCTVKVSADKTEVLRGDKVTFTVTLLKPVDHLGSMAMVLDIPEGLTYVPNSGKLADNLAEVLEFGENVDENGLYFTEKTIMISGYGTKDYSGNVDIDLATFECIVNSDFTGPATVSLKDLEFYSVETWEELTTNVIGAEIALHIHNWAEPSWTWTGSDENGYTAASVTIACTSDPTHTRTVSVVPTVTEDAGYRVYTAAVTADASPDDTPHSDEKRVPIIYSISYTLNGGSASTDNPNTYTVEDLPITLNNPTRSGYEFTGWTGSGLDAVTQNVTIKLGTTGDLSFTANWERSGYEVSGNITSFVGTRLGYPDYVYQEGHVSVILYLTGTDTVVGTATVSDDNKTYTLTGVIAGEYDLKVMKKDHAPRTYAVTVTDTSVTQDVEIHLYGDVDGNGRVTTIDAAMVNYHAKATANLTGYDLIVADVIGNGSLPDGRVSTIDAAAINAHAKGANEDSFLW